MELGQGLQSLRSTILCDKPPWRLRQPEEATELDARIADLQDSRDTPAPRRGHSLSAKSGPGCQNSAQIVHRPVCGRVFTSVGWIGKFRNQHGARLDYEHTSRADDQAGDDELRKCRRSSLDDCSDNLCGAKLAGFGHDSSCPPVQRSKHLLSHLHGTYAGIVIHFLIHQCVQLTIDTAGGVMCLELEQETLFRQLDIQFARLTTPKIPDNKTIFLPNLSLSQPTTGSAITDPIDWAALMRPRRDPVGCPKYDRHCRGCQRRSHGFQRRDEPAAEIATHSSDYHRSRPPMMRAAALGGSG